VNLRELLGILGNFWELSETLENFKDFLGTLGNFREL
jgi:hypothetical protein